MVKQFKVNEIPYRNKFTKAELKIMHRYGLNGEIYDAEVFTENSIFGAAHSGELKGIKEPVLKLEIVKKP